VHDPSLQPAVTHNGRLPPSLNFSLGAGCLEGESMPIHEIPRFVGRLFGWNVPEPFARHVVRHWRPAQSAVSPQRDNREPAPTNASNTVGVRLSRGINAAGIDKRPGGIFRDEEVVGSNPATPTASEQLEHDHQQHAGGRFSFATSRARHPPRRSN
jgi:hypothetical protein